jgi:CheY-specific phosphatase CheX
MNFELLARQTLTEACSALIPAADESAAQGQSDELCIAAVIGFSGDDLRGTLGVAASAGGLERVRRQFGAPESKLGAADALGELANLILGQMKREWSRYGVLATLSTPLVMRGLSIEVCGRSDGNWYEQHSGLGADRVTVWLDAHAEAGLQVEREPIDSGLVHGGDALMF